MAAEDEAVADGDAYAPLGINDAGIDDADEQKEDAGAETRCVSIDDDGAAAGNSAGSEKTVARGSGHVYSSRRPGLPGWD